MKTADIVASEIVDWIAEGRFVAGDRLPSEAELITHFDVSRGPIREAMRLLENTGVVRLKSGRGGGAFVERTGLNAFAETSALYLQLAGATYRDLFDALALTEPLLAGQAALRRTSDDLRHLHADIETIEQIAPSDLVTQKPSIVRFHTDLAAASDNRALALHVGGIIAAVGDRVAPVIDPHGTGAVGRQHIASIRKILGAIEAGDAGAAERSTRRHVVAVRETIEAEQPELLAEQVRWKPRSRPPEGSGSLETVASGVGT